MRTAAAPQLHIQRDHTLIVRTETPDWPMVRDVLRPLAELVRLGGGYATYRLTPLALWNAVTLGMTAAAILAVLRDLSGAPVPPATAALVQETVARAGSIRLVPRGDGAALVSDDAALLERLRNAMEIALPAVERSEDGGAIPIPSESRGRVKLALAASGYPVSDASRVITGDVVTFALREDAPPLRSYQREAVTAFTASPVGGLVVLPCGAGKTLVGIAAAAHLGMRTLVLCPGRSNAAQWDRAFRAWTTLADDAVGIFDGSKQTLFPVTIATYQALTHRATKDATPVHLGTFLAENWGLVIYDEAHTLPAAGFRLCGSAAMQSRRRLGLTATLVREDGRETDVYALIGPALYQRPWRELEVQGWIAPARCVEVRVPLAPGWPPASMEPDARAVALNPAKDVVVERLIARHRGASTLVIGAHLDLLRRIARRLRAPLVTGATTAAERERQYGAFRGGENRTLVVSGVVNQGIDLPQASVAVQVSGNFGSRQEEAQRLGRILRPNADGTPSTFYTLVTRGTDEIRFAQHRRIYLSEQGYTYAVERQ